VSFALGDVSELLRADAQRAHDVVVDHDAPAGGQRSHRELRVAGRAQLAHDERVEGSAEGRGHFPCHRDTAACQAQHDDVISSVVGGEQVRQHPTGLAAVTEHAPGALRWASSAHHHSL
jgi:hypothetical protein